MKYLAALALAVILVAWLYVTDQMLHREDYMRTTLVECHLERIQGTFDVSLAEITGDGDYILAYREDRTFLFPRAKLAQCQGLVERGGLHLFRGDEL
jgi:hypothetical protein